MTIGDIVLLVTLVVLVWQVILLRSDMRQKSIQNIYDRYQRVGFMEVLFPQLEKMTMFPEIYERLGNLSDDDIKLRALSLFIFDQFALIFNLGERSRFVRRFDTFFRSILQNKSVRGSWLVRHMPGKRKLAGIWNRFVERGNNIWEINEQYIRQVLRNPILIHCWRDLGLSETWKGTGFYELVEEIIAKKHMQDSVDTSKDV
jgi:hypothetical protein